MTAPGGDVVEPPRTGGDVLERRHGLATYRRPGPPGAPRVVLVHGSMDRAATFLLAARHLDHLEVVRYDRRGYGRSPGPVPEPTMETHLADLLAVLDGRPAAVVGHSFGGIVALAAAQRHPELVPTVGVFEAPMPWAADPAVAAVGPALLRVARDEGPEVAAEAFMRRVVGDERWARLPERTRAQRRAEGPALVADMTAVHGGGAPPFDPTAVAVPVVAGHGSATLDRHVAATRALVAGAPRAELVVVPGGAHDAPATHPDAFAALVARVVERWPAGA